MFGSDDKDTHAHFLIGSHQSLRILPWFIRLHHMILFLKKTSSSSCLFRHTHAPVYMNGHVICLVRCVTMDEDYFWDGAKMLVWTEISFGLNLNCISVDVSLSSCVTWHEKLFPCKSWYKFWTWTNLMSQDCSRIEGCLTQQDDLHKFIHL